MTEFQNKYIELLKSQYPSAQCQLSPRFNNLISDSVIELPVSVFSRVEQTVDILFEYAHSQKFLDYLLGISTGHELAVLQAPAKNFSVLMAYDFHYDFETDLLSLIEINTNASAFLISDLMYKVEPFKECPWGDSLSSLKESFLNELSFSNATPKSIAIIDENVSAQNMYIEFLMFKDLFEKWGFATDISEQSKINLENYQLVYNRYTDFLFSSEKSQHLWQKYINNNNIFSPHPKEYLLVALKTRLIDFFNAGLIDTLIPVYDIDRYDDLEEIWQKRKKLFFKPKASYGSKAVYRGSSISYATFSKNVNKNYIAQEYRPPGNWQEFKFDLRFYVYKKQVQLGVGRRYKGQVTNFNSPGGGFSRIHFA